MTNNLDFNTIDFGDLFNDNMSETSEITVTNKKTANEKTPATAADNINITVLPSVDSKTTSNIGLLQQAQAKMNTIAAELNNEFVERDELIKIMQLAIVTGTNLLMLGMPGTAKSLITYSLCERIENANYFQWMLNKTSDPSEILGPFSVKEMENDKFMRITTGKLPEAHIAFMDEVNRGLLVA